MHAIRQFEVERKEWENERDLLEARERALSTEKEEADAQLAYLHEEIERLRTSQAAAPPTPVRQGPVEPKEQIRSRHEQQLALMAKLDDYRKDLEQEQQRSRIFEQRAAEAEKQNRRLSLDIDRSRGERGGSFGGSDVDFLLGSRRPYQASFTSGTSSIGGSGEPAAGDLQEAQLSLETSRKEVLSLEDETLRLREELNNEKQKVIQLKRAATSRGAAWKEELQKLTEELTQKQRLEEEVAQLRKDNIRFRKELGQVSEREVASRREATRLQQELLEARSEKSDARHTVAEKEKEMEILSKCVGGQLVAVEQELTNQMKKNSQLFELFLEKAHEPLTGLRRSCRKIAASGTAGRELASRQVPVLFEVNVHELQSNLAKIIDLLRFSTEVLEARDIREEEHARRQRQKQQRPQSTSVVEDTTRSWMKPFMAQ